MNYIRYGEHGFEIPANAKTQEEVRAAADEYIKDHSELSDEEIAEIKQMVASFIGQVPSDTTATGTGVNPSDSIATGTGVNPDDTVIGTEGGDEPGSNGSSQPEYRYWIGSDGTLHRSSGSYANGDYKEESVPTGHTLKFEETPNPYEIFMGRIHKENQEYGKHIDELIAKYNTPEKIAQAAREGLISEDEVNMLRREYTGEKGALNYVRDNREAYQDKYVLGAAKEAGRQNMKEWKDEYAAEQKAKGYPEFDENGHIKPGTAGKGYYHDMAELLDHDFEEEKFERWWRNVAEPMEEYRNLSQEEKEALQKKTEEDTRNFYENLPGVEEEDIYEEPIPTASYNDMYHNASKADLRRYKRGKGYTNAAGFDFVTDPAKDRYGRSQVVKSIKKGRKQDVQDYLNGEYDPNKYMFAPEIVERPRAAKIAERKAKVQERKDTNAAKRAIMNGTYQSQRNGGVMMRTLLSAMRRGGRL